MSIRTPDSGHIKTNLEIARLFELHHVALTLERAAGGEEDILGVAVDVFLPRREPGDRIVMDNLCPLSTRRRLRDRNTFPDVDGDVAGADAQLEAALLRVFATSAEETWRFDPEVADFLLATVEHAGFELSLECVPLLLDLLLLSGGHSFLGVADGSEVVIHRTEVALFDARDADVVALHVASEQS